MTVIVGLGGFLGTAIGAGLYSLIMLGTDVVVGDTPGRSGRYPRTASAQGQLSLFFLQKLDRTLEYFVLVFTNTSNCWSHLYVGDKADALKLSAVHGNQNVSNLHASLFGYPLIQQMTSKPGWLS